MTAPNLVGRYVFGDVVTGRIFQVPLEGLVIGKPTGLLNLVGAAGAGLRFGQGPGTDPSVKGGGVEALHRRMINMARGRC